LFVYLRCRVSCGWFDNDLPVVCLSEVLLDFRIDFPCCCVCLFKQCFLCECWVGVPRLLYFLVQARCCVRLVLFCSMVLCSFVVGLSLLFGISFSVRCRVSCGLFFIVVGDRSLRMSLC
jgi:hypothetical protein